jgi:single-stranded DNA-binding protein
MPSSSTKPSASTSKAASKATSAEAVESPALNLAVLCGPCSGPAEVRVLESGTRLATLAVRCPTGPGADERATSVPVTVWDPPAWVETLAAGDTVVVVGRMRRRFYQRPGGVGSRVDVEAELVGRARDRRRIDAALRKADEALEALG